MHLAKLSNIGLPTFRSTKPRHIDILSLSLQYYWWQYFLRAFTRAFTWYLQAPTFQLQKHRSPLSSTSSTTTQPQHDIRREISQYIAWVASRTIVGIAASLTVTAFVAPYPSTFSTSTNVLNSSTAHILYYLARTIINTHFSFLPSFLPTNTLHLPHYLFKLLHTSSFSSSTQRSAETTKLPLSTSTYLVLENSTSYQ